MRPGPQGQAMRPGPQGPRRDLEAVQDAMKWKGANGQMIEGLTIVVFERGQAVWCCFGPFRPKTVGNVEVAAHKQCMDAHKVHVEEVLVAGAYKSDQTAGQKYSSVAWVSGQCNLGAADLDAMNQTAAGHGQRFRQLPIPQELSVEVKQKIIVNVNTYGQAGQLGVFQVTSLQPPAIAAIKATKQSLQDQASDAHELMYQEAADQDYNTIFDFQDTGFIANQLNNPGNNARLMAAAGPSFPQYGGKGGYN